jgi:RNA polymerase sigma-70 factor (ECF subfamily)
MQALQRLTPDHREVLALRYFRDLKLEDIARVLGCPAGTVKSRINRALGAMRAEMDHPTVQEVR